MYYANSQDDEHHLFAGGNLNALAVYLGAVVRIDGGLLLLSSCDPQFRLVRSLYILYLFANRKYQRKRIPYPQNDALSLWDLVN